MRRAAREFVFKLIFEYTFYEQRNDNTLELLLLDDGLDESDREYINSTYDGIIRGMDELRSVISAHLNNYRIERLYRPDLAVLLLGAYELKKHTDPVAVIVNEAVELSKKYGTDKSGGFVNGVLAAVSKDIRA